jgi:plasmid replication initiation protein
VPAKTKKNIVQKSRPIQSLTETDLTLSEFKLLDTYLALINSHDPESRSVCLRSGEVEKLLDVTKISKENLESRLRGLFKVVKIIDDNAPDGFRLISLFEEAEAVADSDDRWAITLTCTKSAKEYIFNIENLGYLKYRLKNIVGLRSRYSYVMYLYLQKNKFRSTWEVSLRELKTILNCSTDSYQAFKVFNDRVLKQSQKEILSKTDIRYEYTPLKNGRTVTAIRFDILDELLPEPDTLSVEYSTDSHDFLADACDREFSEEQITLLFDLVAARLPDDNKGFDRYHYLKRKYDEMCLRSPANRFAYLKRMIEIDTEEINHGKNAETDRG